MLFFSLRFVSDSCRDWWMNKCDYLDEVGKTGVGDENGWDIATGGSFAGGGSDDLDWDHKSMWSTGLSKEHFDGVSVGRQNNNAAANPPSSDSSSGDVMSKLGPREAAMVNEMNEYDDMIKEIEKENRHSRGFVDGIKQKMMEMSVLLKQVKEPGARGSYLKDSEKTEMYRLHTENPEVYIVERLAKDFRIMRQRWKGEVKCHKYSRRRSSDGWKITVEKLGPQGKHGNGGGWKFVSLPDGSSRPLNEVEKMYVKREAPHRRRKILS
ncbi:mucin-related [Raphanus sativus]|nr:mucin-related [Raphanus sativus]